MSMGPIPRAVMNATQGVCRIRTAEGVATGFLIRARMRGEQMFLLITAAHVLSRPKATYGAEVTAHNGAAMSLAPRRLFLTDPMSDITVCAVRSSEVLPSIAVSDEMPGPTIWIAHHPRGRSLKLEQGRVVLETGTPAFLHTVPTKPGSSGAPVLNRSGEVVGVHVASNVLSIPELRNIPIFEASRITLVKRLLHREQSIFLLNQTSRNS